jgi:hypothetical protein
VRAVGDYRKDPPILDTDPVKLLDQDREEDLGPGHTGLVVDYDRYFSARLHQIGEWRASDGSRQSVSDGLFGM